jgi:penicillin amidase
MKGRHSFHGWFLWKDDITEYLDFSKNPSAVNPEWNYVYSANNQPEAD